MAEGNSRRRVVSLAPLHLIYSTVSRPTYLVTEEGKAISPDQSASSVLGIRMLVASGNKYTCSLSPTLAYRIVLYFTIH